MTDEILFLAHRIPWPPDRGDKIRSHWELRKLAELAPVHVATFAEDERDASFTGEMADICQTVLVEPRTKSNVVAGLQAVASGKPVSLSAFGSDKLRDHVAKLVKVRPITRIFVFSGQMAQYVPDDFAGRVVMDFVDVDSAKFESYAKAGNPAMRWINAREGRLLSAFERDFARRADLSLFVSPAEAALFRQRSGLDASKVGWLGNGIDHRFFDPATTFAPAPLADFGIDADAPLFVFTGQMDYRPNIEAVEDFARNVLPNIRNTHADAQFAIVGRAPGDAVKALAKLPGVTVTGAVDDVRSWLAAATIVVAPLRIARGIQNKVLEAMAMARPVLVSTAAAEGIDATEGAHWRVASSAEEEARIACDMLADPEALAAMGQAARAHVVATYDWSAQLAPLPEMMALSPVPTSRDDTAPARSPTRPPKEYDADGRPGGGAGRSRDRNSTVSSFAKDPVAAE